MADNKPKPRISMILPLPVSLLLIVFFFLPWLTLSCDGTEFARAAQKANPQEMPPMSSMSAMPEVTAEIGQASGRQLAEGDISLKGASARQQNPLGPDNQPLKSRPWLYMALALPILALLLSGLGAAGKANAGTVGVGLLLLGIVGAVTVSLAASIDYVDDAIDKAQGEAPKSSCYSPAPCQTGMQEAKSNMKKFIKTEGMVYLWTSLGMYVLLAGCGIAARSTPLELNFEHERASVPSVVGPTVPHRARAPGADALPDFGPDLVSKPPSPDRKVPARVE